MSHHQKSQNALYSLNIPPLQDQYFSCEWEKYKMTFPTKGLPALLHH
jgi:hypothetical protein